MAHIGSWGTKDYGVTEWLGRQIARLGGGYAPLTADSGSNLFGPPSETKFAQNPNTKEVYPLFYQNSETPKINTKDNTTQKQTTYTPTGGTGGGSQPVQRDGSQPVQQGQSQEDPQERIRREVEAIYSPLMDYLNQAESAVTSEYQRYVPELEQQYATSLSNIQNQKTQGERELAAQEQAAGMRKEDALSAARRLYDELRRGGRQRFGGASSAGQAFTELTAQEQQRQSGNIWQTYQQTLDNLNKYKANLLDNFAQAQKELELAKTSALNQAYSEYQNRLNEIRAKKGQTESAKAQTALEALNNLRNQVYQINLQSLNLAQSLAANRQMALSTVDQYSQRVAQSILGGSTSYQNLVDTTTTRPVSNLTIGGQPTTATTQMGVVQPTNRRPEEYLNYLA